MKNTALQTIGRKTGAMGPTSAGRIGFLFAVIITTGALCLANAHAVDLRNRDRIEHEVTVNHSDGRSETITIKAGQTIADICSDCVVLTDTSSVEVKGNATVKIERGEVSIDGKR